MNTGNFFSGQKAPPRQIEKENLLSRIKQHSCTGDRFFFTQVLHKGAYFRKVLTNDSPNMEVLVVFADPSGVLLLQPHGIIHVRTPF